ATGLTRQVAMGVCVHVDFTAVFELQSTVAAGGQSLTQVYRQVGVGDDQVAGLGLPALAHFAKAGADLRFAVDGQVQRPEHCAHGILVQLGGLAMGIGPLAQQTDFVGQVDQRSAAHVAGSSAARELNPGSRAASFDRLARSSWLTVLPGSGALTVTGCSDRLRSMRSRLPSPSRQQAEMAFSPRMRAPSDSLPGRRGMIWARRSCSRVR